MANTKAKIFIGVGIATFVGVGTFLIFNHFKKKRIMRDIYAKLLDTTSQESQQAQLSTFQKIKGTDALNPKFWQSGKADTAKLLTGKMAREFADKIRNSYNTAYYSTVFGYTFWDTDTEIFKTLKKLKTRGQVSQVAYAYANPPKDYGDLATDINDIYSGWADGESQYKQVLNYLNNLPA
jgi:hypothetical protein